MRKWANKPWYLYTKENYSAIKKNNSAIYVITWINLKNIILSKRNRSQKFTYCMTPYYDILKKTNYRARNQVCQSCRMKGFNMREVLGVRCSSVIVMNGCTNYTMLHKTVHQKKANFTTSILKMNIL